MSEQIKKEIVLKKIKHGIREYSHNCFLREDGLKIFLSYHNGNENYADNIEACLNKIKIYFERSEVIHYTGLIRGLQVMTNYAFHHGTAYDQQKSEKTIQFLLNTLFIPRLKEYENNCIVKIENTNMLTDTDDKILLDIVK